MPCSARPSVQEAGECYESKRSGSGAAYCGCRPPLPHSAHRLIARFRQLGCLILASAAAESSRLAGQTCKAARSCCLSPCCLELRCACRTRFLRSTEGSNDCPTGLQARHRSGRCRRDCHARHIGASRCGMAQRRSDECDPPYAEAGKAQNRPASHDPAWRSVELAPRAAHRLCSCSLVLPIY